MEQPEGDIINQNRVLRDGFVDYVEKPFTAEKICHLIISSLQLDVSSTRIKEPSEGKSDETFSRNRNSSRNKISSITRKESLEESNKMLFQGVKTSSTNKEKEGHKMSQKSQNLLALLSSSLKAVSN